MRIELATPFLLTTFSAKLYMFDIDGWYLTSINTKLIENKTAYTVEGNKIKILISCTFRHWKCFLGVIMNRPKSEVYPLVPTCVLINIDVWIRCLGEARVSVFIIKSNDFNLLLKFSQIKSLCSLKFWNPVTVNRYQIFFSAKWFNSWKNLGFLHYLCKRM